MKVFDACWTVHDRSNWAEDLEDCSVMVDSIHRFRHWISWRGKCDWMRTDNRPPSDPENAMTVKC